MSGTFNPTPPPREDGSLLHRRLCEGDPIASADLCLAYLPHLYAWMERTFPRVHPHDREDAVHRALVSLIESPGSFDPARADLFVYLRMAARGDLLNLLQREARHHDKRTDLQVVELRPDAGKYLGVEDDPAFGLLAAEARPAAGDPVWQAVWERSTAPERRVLELMRCGERRDEVFAEALGRGDPTPEVRKEIKRMKDRLKARLKRAGGGRE